MRIAIVNHLEAAVQSLRAILLADGRHRIAWIAGDGAEAVGRCRDDVPDLILMDLSLPIIDGVEATRRIMQATPCAILIVTATVDGSSAGVFEAMGHGALDAADTPSVVRGKTVGGEALIDKVATIGRLLRRRDQRPTPAEVSPAPAPPQLVAIGASTGGPGALVSILSDLPQDLDAAIVVIQHIDRGFVPGLAEWLGKASRLPVRPIQQGDRPEPATVLIAATDDHLRIDESLELRYDPAPREHLYRPSVDVMFGDLARVWPNPGVAVLLTGMGRDGAEGLLALRQGGWLTIAQDEASSVIYGMPGAAVEVGGASLVRPVDRIAADIAAGLAPRTGVAR